MAGGCLHVCLILPLVHPIDLAVALCTAWIFFSCNCACSNNRLFPWQLQIDLAWTKRNSCAILERRLQRVSLQLVWNLMQFIWFFTGKFRSSRKCSNEEDMPSYISSSNISATGAVHSHRCKRWFTGVQHDWWRCCCQQSGLFFPVFSFDPTPKKLLTKGVSSFLKKKPPTKSSSFLKSFCIKSFVLQTWQP